MQTAMIAPLSQARLGILRCGSPENRPHINGIAPKNLHLIRKYSPCISLVNFVGVRTPSLKTCLRTTMYTVKKAKFYHQ